MVGCGNSKMSEEMADKDAFYQIHNMDISGVVLEKMKYHHESLPEKMAQKKSEAISEEEKTAKLKNLEKLQQFEYLAMDATRMDYRDNSFDIVIDKGTYDALACGTVEGESEGQKPVADK